MRIALPTSLFVVGPLSFAAACGGGGGSAGSNHLDEGAPNSSGGTGGVSLSTGGSNEGGSESDPGPYCGDGLVNQDEEECDDANRTSEDGCTSHCRIEAGYLCAVPGEPCESTLVCGDGLVVGGEECDDGNGKGDDGCSEDCKLEAGYECRLSGAPCSEICGDSLIVGREACDDGNAEGDDGCSEECRLELDTVFDDDDRPRYWVCDAAGEACTRASCGDGTQEGAEPCDDGNDRPGDGCSPACEWEPSCTATGCTSRCGDGIIMPGDDEECDDGNSLDGDGCSAECHVESGYRCEQVAAALPDQLFIPVVYRDFVGGNRALSGAPVHPDFESTRGVNPGTLGLVEDTLNNDGLPELTGLCVGAPDSSGLLTGGSSTCPRGGIAGESTQYYWNQISSSGAFAQWFTDDASVNRTIVSKLCLARVGSSASYVFDSSTDNSSDCGPAITCDNAACRFLPINGQGFVAEGLEVDNLTEPSAIFGEADPTELVSNFSFTSVVRTWFIHQGGEELVFSGDDDVWVFINGRLAVDIGGLHGEVEGSVTLEETTADDLDLVAGRVYPMTLFHAERHGFGSNFKLTLTGFVTARSECQPDCGDGVRVGQEACDNGTENVSSASDSYGECTDECELGPRCGDGVVQEDAGEACDQPAALTVYTQSPGEGCTPGCQRPGYCGDGELQAGYEDCDDADDNTDDESAYASCTPSCHLGPHCGDGIENGPEECDLGEENGNGLCTLGCRVPEVY